MGRYGAATEQWHREIELLERLGDPRSEDLAARLGEAWGCRTLRDDSIVSRVPGAMVGPRVECVTTRSTAGGPS